MKNALWLSSAKEQFPILGGNPTILAHNIEL
jgi:hypothetical protein